MAESSSSKAKRYLAEGSICATRVDEHVAAFTAQGSAKDPYIVKFNGVWRCDCPAHTAACAHIIACQLISDLGSAKPKLGTDPEMEALFAIEAEREDLSEYDPFAEM